MKKALLLISALALSGVITAQNDNRNAVVNVENDYNPEVIAAEKKIFTPSDETVTDNGPITLIFSKTGKAYNGFTSETEITDAMPQKEMPFPGYARLGYGLTNDIDAKVAYRNRLGKNGTFKAYAGFDGYNSMVNGVSVDEWKSRMFNTQAGIGYKYDFKGITLGIDGDFKNNVFNYQSIDNTTDLTDKQDGQNYRVGISGKSNLSGAWSYNFKGDFEYITRNWSSGKKAPISEMRYAVGGAVNYEVLSKWLNNAGIDLNMDAYSYNSTLRNANKGYDKYFSIDANPHFGLTFGKWNVGVGAKMNFLTRGRGFFAIAPDIKAASNLKDNISVYGSITGGRVNNGFARLEERTPYWGFVEGGSTRLKPTYRIVDVNLGTRISFEPLSIGFSVGYAYTKDDIIQVMEQKDGLVYSNFAQDNTHHAFASLNLGYDLRGWLKLSADARYNYWDCKENTLLIMKPEVAVNLNAEARIIENLTFRVGYNYTLYTKTDNGRMADKHDLHARVSYQINKRFGAYIQGSNLLNCKYYEYAGYMTRGARGSLGATVNF